MCKQGKEKQIKLTDGQYKSCDECIQPFVQLLNDNGFQTVASCCGHNKQPTRISLKDKREILIMNYNDAQMVCNLFIPLNPRPREWKFTLRRVLAKLFIK